MPEPRTLIVLGATGDLFQRLLLPGLSGLLTLDDGTVGELELIGAGSSEHSADDWRKRVVDGLADAPRAVKEALLASTRYVQTDATDGDALHALIEAARHPAVLYLALPPAITLRAVEALAAVELPEGTRLAMEKPFGADREGAERLNTLLGTLVPADRVFRVDHFLGKSTVVNLIGLRFANRVLGAVWNRDSIQRIEIVFDETLALEGRARYYDRAGALVDMIQSHLLLVHALVAMEPPASLDADDLHAALLGALRATRVAGDDPVRFSRRARYTAGEVDGTSVPDYTAEEGVELANETETLAEVLLEVDTPRLAGVPVLLRSGKAVGAPASSIRIELSPAPERPRGLTGATAAAVITIALTPERLALDLDINGSGEPTDLDRVTLETDFSPGRLDAYGEVLAGILGDDPTFSVAAEVAEECWRIVEPVLAAWRSGDVPLEEYAAGSSGPATWTPLRFA